MNKREATQNVSNNSVILKLKHYWTLFWPYLIFIFMALFILWAQKNAHAFNVSSDSVFHTNQFYESAMQLKTGHKSWFMTLFGFHQTGRIVNAVYGPVFSYFIGGILNMLGTWVKLQLLMDFTVLILGGMLMYHLARYCYIKRYLSILLGIFYMCSYPITVFLHGEAFSGVGNCIIPLVILAGIKMWKQHQVHAIQLAVLLAIIMQIHLLTTVISVIALIPFACASLYHTKHAKKWFKNLGYSIALFFLLTCNIWGSLLEVFGTNYIIKPFADTAMGSDEFSFGWFDNKMSLFSKPYEYVFLLILALIIFEWKKLNKRQKFIPLLGLGFMFISSTYFPWTKITRILPFLTQTIQIPDRFLGVAMVLMLLTLGLLVQRLDLKDFNKGMQFIVFAILMLLAGDCAVWEESNEEFTAQRFQDNIVFVGNHSNFHPQMRSKHLKWIRHAYNKDHRLSRALKYTVKSIPDYLPSNKPVSIKRYSKIKPYGTELKELLKTKFVNHKVKGTSNKYWTSAKALYPHHYKHYITKNNNLELKWIQPKKKLNKNTQIPAVKYSHTNVIYNGHVLHHVHVDNIGAIHLKPRQRRNSIELSYHPSYLWYITMLTSIISWIILVVLLMIDKLRKYLNY